MLASRTSIKVVLLLLLPLACYWPALRGEWLFDDRPSIVENPLVTSPDGLGKIWLSSQQIDYWPVSYTAFWLQLRLWGHQTLGFHLVSLGLHSVVALLAWQVLARLQAPGAWTAALLFAVHPVNVESVAWIFQQKTMLAAIGFLASVWTYLEFDQTARRRWHVAALVCFTLAMLAKSSVVVLPAVLLLCAWWQRGRVARRDQWAMLPFCAIALLLGLIGVWFQSQRAMGEIAARDEGGLARLAGAGWAVWFYLAKAVWPANLAFVYPRWQIDGALLLAHVPWLLIAGMLGIAWHGRGGWGRAVLFALAYTLLALLPVLGFVDISFMRHSLVADHWQYLALLGPLALGAGTMFQFARRWPATNRFAPTLAAACVMLCCLLTWQQSHLYLSGIALWSDTVAKNQASWLAHNNLGQAHAEGGNAAAAEASFRVALQLLPDEAVLQGNLGLALCAQQQFAEGLPLLQRAADRRPHDSRLAAAAAEVYKLQGGQLAQQGDARGAIEHYRRALAFRPPSPAVASHLAWLLVANRQATPAELSEALQWVELACRETDRQHPVALDTLAAVYAALGRLDEATAAAQQARHRAAALGQHAFAQEVQQRLDGYLALSARKQ